MTQHHIELHKALLDGAHGCLHCFHFHPHRLSEIDWGGRDLEQFLVEFLGMIRGSRYQMSQPIAVAIAGLEQRI